MTSALHTCTHLASPGGGGGRVLPRGPSQSLPEGAGSAASPTVWLWEGESPLRPSRKEGTEPGAAPGEVPSLSEPQLRGGTWHSPVPGPRHRGPQRGPGVRQFGDDEAAEAAGQPVCSAASRPAPPPSSPSCVPCLLTGVPENPASSPHGQLSQPGVSPARGPEAAGLSGGPAGVSTGRRAGGTAVPALAGITHAVDREGSDTGAAARVSPGSGIPGWGPGPGPAPPESARGFAGDPLLASPVPPPSAASRFRNTVIKEGA